MNPNRILNSDPISFGFETNIQIQNFKFVKFNLIGIGRASIRIRDYVVILKLSPIQNQNFQLCTIYN